LESAVDSKPPATPLRERDPGRARLPRGDHYDPLALVDHPHPLAFYDTEGAEPVAPAPCESPPFDIAGEECVQFKRPLRPGLRGKELVGARPSIASLSRKE
jgi:hypothetical protein